MTEKLLRYLIALGSSFLCVPFGKEVLVFFISSLPVLELRGGILAASLLKVEPRIGFLIALIGNLWLIPLVLYFIMPLFERFKKSRFLRKYVKNLETRTLKKKDEVLKSRFFGLLFFVAIPLPGTGAYTGALLAALLGMEKKEAFISIMLGVIGAGLIMMFLSYGVLGMIYS